MAPRKKKEVVVEETVKVVEEATSKVEHEEPKKAVKVPRKKPVWFIPTM